MREIAEAFVAPGVEKVTIQKSARIGFSTLLSSLIAWHLTERPAAIMVVLPAEQDARNAVVALEELFDCSPSIAGRLPNPSLGRSDRNTILFRRGRRPWLVETANRVARAGLVLVALTTCGVVFLTFDLAIGRTGGIVASIVAFFGYLVLWVGIPLRARP